MKDPVSAVMFELYAAFIILEVAGCCGPCKASHYFFVNRNGRTICVACDAREQQAEKSTRAMANGA